jgi:signal transduction histidine kinase
MSGTMPSRTVEAVITTPVFSPRGADEMAPYPCPKPVLNSALGRVRLAIHRRLAAARALHTTLPLPGTLEETLWEFLRETIPETGVRFRMFLQGKPRAVKPIIREQLFLIAREAIVNALRHSKATKIEVELEYMRWFLSVSVRDNGCGFNPDTVQKTEDWRGLHGMRARAETINAQFEIWSRPRAGTEVRITVRTDVGIAPE